jgi:hypothetical protein
MEGNTSRILETSDPSVVQKTLKRGKRGILSIETQYSIQSWAAELLIPKNGFTVLETPVPSGLEGRAYRMKRIDDSSFLEYNAVDTVPGLRKELASFFQKAKEKGLYPNDFELFVQSTGKVVLLDFDKFGTWTSTGTVQFPWGLEMPDTGNPFEN